MTFPLPIPDPLRQALPPGTGVLLGISGGVDSAVSLALLRALDCDVQCVTFKNFCYSDDDAFTDKSCCSLDAIDDARRLARSFDVPHWVSDVEKPFRQSVIEPFVDEYARARTPNPCLDCNGVVRFPELVRLAERQGCAFAATGHYARIARGRLLRGLDPEKDQSYFLHRVDRCLFDRLVFPLGWYVKDQVRRAARELGIPVADKRDSQEICFVPEGDRGFLFEQISDGDDRALVPGDIVDRSGGIRGRHRGLIHYTVGQRKGLGIAAPDPLYVLELDLDAGRLVVGSKEELRTLTVEGDDFVPAVPDFPARWSSDDPLPGIPDTDGGEAVLRIRHRHGGARIGGWILEGDRIRVDLVEPVDGAAPGQGLVLYGGDMVLGGARIISDSR
ncbi:MAG: tRNA 2-thiouridine(34) synthase MnmA [Candidatus Krumholzibacteria bacterium]|nr:tRNA 2-thiouridine(34) synthase MnmA [Candidatus Krumholzibacteria bacterium]